MTVAEFFWLDDAKFAQRLSQAIDEELLLGDKHNVRKRKGGKLGAWVGTAQAPMTLGISLFGTGIAARNRVVAKRRLEMIHAELRRRGLHAHAEDWKDGAFAALAVGTGAVVGMGFVPGADIAAQGLWEAGATESATYLAGLATSEVIQHTGALVTEQATAHYTDPDTYFNRPKELVAGVPDYSYYCGHQQQLASAEAMPSPSASYTPGMVPTPPPQYLAGYMMPIPPAPYYG